MNKSWLSIVFVGIAAQGMTQTSHFLPQPGTSDASINIAVSSHDENDGNTYFGEAEKNIIARSS
jgi:hypothetical protein